MTEQLASFLRDNWSYEGLEVTGVSQTAVTASIGPNFPISELVMHVGDPGTFDATIDITTLPTGAALKIRPTAAPAKTFNSLNSVAATIGMAACVVAGMLSLAPAVYFRALRFYNVTL